MTTVTADIVNASVAGNPVNIRGLTHQSPNGAQIRFDSSGNTTGKSVTFVLQTSGAGGPVSYPIFFRAGSSPAVLPRTDVPNTFSNYNMGGFIKTDIVNTAALVGSTIINPIFTSGTSVVKLASNSVNTSAATNLIINIPDSTTVDITFPSEGGTILTLEDAITYDGIQTFSSGIKTNTIASAVTNGNITLSGNGTGSVVSNNKRIQNQISGKTTNGNLSLAGNGTGTTTFDTNGLNFTNGGSALKDYTVGSFTTQFTCGTFNSGNITIQFERIGKRVILRVPNVTGTPNVDQVWNATNLPSNLQPTVTQIQLTGIGTKNNAILGEIYCKLSASSSTWVISFNSDTGGFGTTGTCGWSSKWSVTYFLN